MANGVERFTTPSVVQVRSLAHHDRFRPETDDQKPKVRFKVAKFSKQDYVGIANVIDTTWRKLFVGARTEHERFCVKVDMEAVTTAFADMFAADNPRFDRERFVRACEGGVES